RKFAVSALARYTPRDFIKMVEAHGIAYHEKALGQLFCDGSALQIIAMLTAEMAKAGAVLRLATTIEAVERDDTGYTVRLSSGPVRCTSLVIATGGKSIPKMGGTAFGYRLAQQFGLGVTETRPGLVPLTFEPRMLENLAPLAGVSTDVAVRCGKARFEEAMLFTH